MGYYDVEGSVFLQFEGYVGVRAVIDELILLRCVYYVGCVMALLLRLSDIRFPYVRVRM